MLCASSASDNLTQIALSVSLPAYQSLSGKTTTNLSDLNPATTAVFISAGQSIGSNSVSTGGVVTPYVPTSINHIYNLNAYDGSVTKGQDPLIGCSSPWGNYHSRLADLIVLNNLHGWTDVVLVPVAIGGSSIENWLPGANLYENYTLAAAKRVAWWGLNVTAFLWDQGTSNVGTTTPSYTTSMNSVIGVPRAAGFSAPWFLAKSTMQSDGVTLVPTVRAALAAMANGTDIFAGPDVDARSGATNRNASSMPHLTDIGAQLVAGDWYTALDQVF